MNKSYALCYKHWKEQKRIYDKKRASLPHIKEMMKKYNQSIYGKYSYVKRRARIRNLEMKLDLNFFIKATKKNCYYCGGTNKTKGLDRINSNLGYLKDNVVSCCIICNKMKSNYLKDFFINHCKKIIKNMQG